MLGLAYAGLAATTVVCHFVTVPVYAQMILMTMQTIYLGSHLSLPNVDAAAPQQQLEQMSRKDAWMFPVVGSCMLLSLYFVFKYLPEYYVNLAVKGYFFAIGTFALCATLAVAAQVGLLW